MNIRKYSKTGSFHAGAGVENQDYLYSLEGRDYLAVMLADGATACKQGRRGALLACEAAGQIIQKEGKTFFHYPGEKIAYLMTEQILYWVERYKREEEDIHDYGSTFILAFMEKKTGRTVLINLGDGAIFSVKDQKSICVMKPERYRGHPGLTTTNGVYRLMRVAVRNVALGESVLLCSDGFLDLLNRGSGLEVPDLSGLELLENKMMGMENKDDCSYIGFVRERK